MFGILKKQKSRRTVGSCSMMTMKEKTILLNSHVRKFKKKKQVKETSDDKIRRKADEDCALLNDLNSGMRCRLTQDCDNLQVSENPNFMGDIVGDVKKKQHKQSCADNCRAKELQDCERNMMLTNQDNLQNHVNNIIDSGTCKYTLYSDGTYKIELNIKNTEKCISMRDCNNFQPEACDVEKNGKDMPMTFQLNICSSKTGQDKDEQFNKKPIAIVAPTRHWTNTISEASSTTSLLSSLEGNTNELFLIPEVDTDGDTSVETDESDDVHTVNRSSNMEPDIDNTFVKDVDWSSGILSCSIENNSTNVPSLQGRVNRSFEEINTSSIVSIISSGLEMVQKTAGQEMVQETARQKMMQETAGQEMLQETAGQEIVQETAGQKMVQETAGQIVQETAGQETLQETFGQETMQETAGQEMLQETAGQIVQETAGQETLQETFGQETVQETAGQETVQETAGQETVQETENVRNFNRNDSYSEDQNSRKESIKDDVTEIQIFDQTDVQHQNIQDSHLVHSDYTLSPQKSGHSPQSVRVGNPQEENNASCHTQMFTKLDHEMKHSSVYDLPDSCITDMTATKLVQKVDHLESEISKLSKLVFAMMSNLRFPGNVKKQYAVIPEFQENCKSFFNDDDIISLINGSSLQVASLLDNSVIHPECWEHNGHSSSACVSQASIASDLESLQYSGLKQFSQTTNHCIMAEEKKTCSYSNNKGEAVKTDTMLKVQKDSKRGEPANQPTSMLTVERPAWDTRAESDEIGHTFSLQTDLGEDNLDHNMDIKESREGQAEQSSLVVEMDDAKKHGRGSLQLKDSEDKEQNHNEDKSRCLSEVSLPQSIIIGHTNKTPTENTDNDAQLETSNSTTPEFARATDSRGFSVMDNPDTEEIPMMDDKPAFINSDADVSCLRESVKDQVILKTDETAVSTSKLNLEASDSCSNADSIHKSCLDQKETVVGLSSCDLKVKETACCFNTYATHADDASSLHLVDSNVNVIPINTDHCVHFRDMDPVISDAEHIPGPAQPEVHQQRQSSFGYSCDHLLQVQDKSKEELTRESNFIQDSDPEQPRANKFESMCRVQKEKLKETSSVLNIKKSQRGSKLGVNVSCRHCSLQRKRSGKKRKVKLRKDMELGRKVSHTENFPGMLRNLKILLHYLASSFAQDTVHSGNLTQATKLIKGKTDFAKELGIVVSKKNDSSQESLIDDFLQSLVSTWFIFPTISSGLQRVILLPTGLQLYFERLLRGTPPEERERMSYEWLRLQTFINYPASAPGNGIRLARAGFYYSGNSTVTVCYACGGQHSGWNFHDDPFEIHRRISPDCPFLRGNPTYPNVPIMQEGELIGSQMGSNTSNTPLSPTMVNSLSSSNRISEMSLPAAFQSQSSTITQAQSSAALLPSIHNSQEGESEQQVSQQTMPEVEPSMGTAEDITLQPADAAENTQHKSAVVFGLVEPSGQVEDPGVVPTPGVDPTPQTMSEQPKHPEYAPLSSRVNSYTSWPAHLDQTPQQMAEAGFYYAGINDYTHCFQCGGGLRNWDPGDNPWIEHARWYPQCAYVLGKRGQTFVNAVLKKQAELVAAQRINNNTSTTSVTTTTYGTNTTTVTTTSGTTTTIVTTMTSGTTATSGTTTTTVTTITNGTTTTSTSSGAISKTCNAPVLEPAMQTGQLRYFQNPNENEIANRLINEMGYQRERIREAILEVKRRRGQQEIAVEHVIELLIADEERRARVPSASSAFNNREELQSNNSAAANRLPSQPLQEATPPLAFDAESLREEYLRLRDQNLCKICMERNVELAFLPCGHLVCCEVCGQTLRFCPICRAKIHASVKTYLS
ncbi:hypothetical protein CHS0354_004531 [Potamilus streckersoni]|uniref:RING-type domain-containing protein n=1 Tax=Potamilus streckersoni TaxID=2493646 RepID=A0AAE0S5N3_9BIVA|nr:hypothetical protein CHS0354_004531 [Potamilus streckersoni]